MHGSSLKYAWLSDGTKVSARADDGNGEGVQKRYLGSFVYTSNTGSSADEPTEVESVAWDEGRIFFSVPIAFAEEIIDPVEGSGGDPDPVGFVDTVAVDSLAWVSYYRDCWFAGDHLGNVRSMIDITPGLSSPQILEQNDYLPFGTKIQNPNHAAIPMGNRWRYAGKETQHFGSLNLSLLDFGARMYDPFTARWTSVDRLAQDYPTYGPASFCVGNPVLYRDPDGNDLVLFGTDGSCLTVETVLIDWTYNLNINWGGTYTLNGNEALSAVLDIVGVFDQSGISDAINAKLQWSDGRHFDAVMSGLSAIPAIGDFAKLTRIKKDSEVLGVAYDAVVNAGRLQYLRRKAVKEAWKKERELILRGERGTRAWTQDEIKELIKTGENTWMHMAVIIKTKHTDLW